MRMPEELQVLDLSLNSTSHVTTDKLSTCNNFESNFLTGNAVSSKLYLSKGTFAERPNDLILADSLLSLMLLGWCHLFLMVTCARNAMPAMIWGLVLGPTIRRGRERDRKLLIIEPSMCAWWHLGYECAI
jgi:hypothetical protein